MRPSGHSIYALFCAFYLINADEHYDRKRAILNGGVKRYRCVEEWVPVDSFGNLLHEGVKEIQSTIPRLETSHSHNPSSILLDYIRGLWKEEPIHHDSQTVFRRKPHNGHQQHGVRIHEPRKVTELGAWERELLETLEEESTTQTPESSHKTTTIEKQIQTTTEYPRTNLFIPKTTTTTTETSRRSSKSRKTERLGEDGATYLGSTGPPLNPTTTTFLFPTHKNRMQIGGMKSRGHLSVAIRKEEISSDFDDETREMRRHEETTRERSKTSPIRPQTKHRPSHQEDEREEAENREIDSLDFEDSDDEEREFQPRRRPFIESERFERPLSRGHQGGQRGVRRPQQLNEYEDFYGDYEEMPRRRPRPRQPFPPFEDDFLAFRQFTSRRRAPSMPRYGPNYNVDPRRHLSTLPMSRDVRGGHPPGQPPLPILHPPSPSHPFNSPLPSIDPHNPPIYHRPKELPFPAATFPLPALVEPVRVTPNPDHASVRRRERVYPSPRPQVTSLPIQPIPQPAQRVTPGTRRHTTASNPPLAPPDPSDSTPNLEESTPENCNKMKQLAGIWGIADVVEFSKSNCDFIRGFAPKYSCEEITHFVESCYRKNFFT